MAGIKKNSRLQAAANGAGAEQLQYLIRAILAIAEPLEEVFHGDQPGNENILVDIDLDGVRYLLVQMPAADQNRYTLSPRELEIARMVAQGHQNKIIASILNISTWTVCAHVRRIFAKLSVSSRAAMVARLLEHDRSLKAPPTLAPSIAPRTPLPLDAPCPVPPLQKQERQTFAREPVERRMEARGLLIENAKRSVAQDRGAPRSPK